MTLCDGQLYVIGGRDMPLGGASDVRPTDAYRVLPPHPSGKHDLVVYRELWRCDLATGEWQELDHPPRAFVARAFTVADRWIVLAGGATWIVHPPGVSVPIRSHVPKLGFRCHSHEVWAYDTQTAEWLALDPLPYGIDSYRVGTWEDRVYLVGNETLDPLRSSTYGTVFEGQIEIP